MKAEDITARQVLVVGGIVIAILAGAAIVAVTVFNVGQSTVTSGAVTTSTAALSASTTTVPTGRTGSYRVTTSDGDVVLVSVSVQDPARADGITAGGSTLAGLCGISGMRGTRAMATKVVVTLELQTPAAVAPNPSQGLDFIATDTSALYASNYSNGWNCSNGASVVIGYVGEGLQPQTPKTYEGWWVTVPDASQSANLNVEAVTPVGRWPITAIQGDATITCGTYTYLRVNGNGCR